MIFKRIIKCHAFNLQWPINLWIISYICYKWRNSLECITTMRMGNPWHAQNERAKSSSLSMSIEICHYLSNYRFGTLRSDDLLLLNWFQEIRRFNNDDIIIWWRWLLNANIHKLTVIIIIHSGCAGCVWHVRYRKYWWRWIIIHFIRSSD